MICIIIIISSSSSSSSSSSASTMRRFIHFGSFKRYVSISICMEMFKVIWSTFSCKAIHMITFICLEGLLTRIGQRE
jgi:hypothetical protein